MGRSNPYQHYRCFVIKNQSNESQILKKTDNMMKNLGLSFLLKNLGVMKKTVGCHFEFFSCDLFALLKFCVALWGPFLKNIFSSTSLENKKKHGMEFLRGEFITSEKVLMKPVDNVTASSGTAISTDFATLTYSEILSKILIRCVTWH